MLDDVTLLPSLQGRCLLYQLNRASKAHIIAAAVYMRLAQNARRLQHRSSDCAQTRANYITVRPPFKSSWPS
jgi:hypothetical protein